MKEKETLTSRQQFTAAAAAALFVLLSFFVPLPFLP
jgi:hypothetical protein